MGAGYKPQNQFKDCEMSDNRSARTNALWILASGDGPASLAALACVKGRDIPARKEYGIKRKKAKSPASRQCVEYDLV